MEVMDRGKSARRKRSEEGLEEKSDVELVRLFRNKGENHVFGALVTRYRLNLAMIARSVLGRESDVEDMVQEPNFMAYTNIDMLADEGRFGAWLKRILFGCCIDFL